MKEKVYESGTVAIECFAYSNLDTLRDTVNRFLDEQDVVDIQYGTNEMCSEVMIVYLR